MVKQLFLGLMLFFMTQESVVAGVKYATAYDEAGALRPFLFEEGLLRYFTRSSYWLRSDGLIMRFIPGLRFEQIIKQVKKVSGSVEFLYGEGQSLGSAFPFCHSRDEDGSWLDGLYVLLKIAAEQQALCGGSAKEAQKARKVFRFFINIANDISAKQFHLYGYYKAHALWQPKRYSLPLTMPQVDGKAVLSEDTSSLVIVSCRKRDGGMYVAFVERELLVDAFPDSAMNIAVCDDGGNGLYSPLESAEVFERSLEKVSGWRRLRVRKKQEDWLKKEFVLWYISRDDSTKAREEAFVRGIIKAYEVFHRFGEWYDLWYDYETLGRCYFLDKAAVDIRRRGDGQYVDRDRSSSSGSESSVSLQDQAVENWPVVVKRQDEFVLNEEMFDDGACVLGMRRLEPMIAPQLSDEEEMSASAAHASDNFFVEE